MRPRFSTGTVEQAAQDNYNLVCDRLAGRPDLAKFRHFGKS